MKLELKHYNNQKAIETFLRKNGVTEFSFVKTDSKIELQIPDSEYSEKELRILKRHFSFYDIFFWSNKGVENVVLWEKPQRINDVFIRI